MVPSISYICHYLIEMYLMMEDRHNKICKSKNCLESFTQSIIYFNIYSSWNPWPKLTHNWYIISSMPSINLMMHQDYSSQFVMIPTIKFILVFRINWLSRRNRRSDIGRLIAALGWCSVGTTFWAMSVDCFTACVVNISIRDIVLLSYRLWVNACTIVININIRPRKSKRQNGMCLYVSESSSLRSQAT